LESSVIPADSDKNSERERERGDDEREAAKIDDSIGKAVF